MQGRADGAIGIPIARLLGAPVTFLGEQNHEAPLSMAMYALVVPGVHGRRSGGSIVAVERSGSAAPGGAPARPARVHPEPGGEMEPARSAGHELLRQHP